MVSLQGLVRPNTDDFSVFVGDLAPDVTDYMLQEAFRQFFPSVKSAKVITDPATGRSKGYGFVRFTNEQERDRALDMQGYQISNRPIRVSLATARRNPGPGGVQHPSELDPNNTTLFIGGLSAGVTEDQLRAIFSQYGDVVYTKIPQGKGCGFVQFRERPAAEVAMAELNGQILGASAIRISWGRSTSRAALMQQRAGLMGAPLGGGYPGGFDAGLYGGGVAPAVAGTGGLYAAAAGTDGYTFAGAQQYGVEPAAAAAYPAYGSTGLFAPTAAVPQVLGAPFSNQQQLLGLAALQQQQVYDPMSVQDPTKLNTLYVQQQQGPLLGNFLQRQGP